VRWQQQLKKNNCHTYTVSGGKSRIQEVVELILFSPSLINGALNIPAWTQLWKNRGGRARLHCTWLYFDQWLSKEYYLRMCRFFLLLLALVSARYVHYHMRYMPSMGMLTEVTILVLSIIC